MGAEGGFYLWKTQSIGGAKEARRKLRDVAKSLAEEARRPALYDFDRKSLEKTANALLADPSPANLVKVFAVHGLQHHEDPDCLAMGYGTNLSDADQIAAEELRQAFRPDIEQETWT